MLFRKEVKKMNKKNFFLSLLILSLSVIALIKTSGAYFSSQAVSILNQFGTSNMKLVLTDQNEVAKPLISHTWEASSLKPGDIIPQQVITLKNDSSINGHHIDVEFSYTGSEDLAKNIFMTNANNGFRYGVSPADTSSVNLITGLKGGSDVDYQVFKGVNGSTISTIDGADGTTQDGKISLAELAAFGKIRITSNIFPDSESDGFRSQSEASLWLNAEVGTGLTAQNENLEVKITLTLDQDASQF